MRVDAHHHLWHYTPQDYDWISDAMLPIRRSFLPPELESLTQAAGMDATIAVQARQTLEETHWLLAAADTSPVIRGVVGWAPIAAPDFAETLAQLTSNPLLKGLRHVVQAELPGFLHNPAFNQGISALLPTGLVYDLLIYAPQLSEATLFVDRHPNQQFVLDHVAKPGILQNAFASWSEDIRELALRPNVVCKLSGLVTEADWHTWSASTLAPYFETVLESFTPSRLLFGSDWPVVNLASTYSQWLSTVESWCAPLTSTEQADILGATAARTYRLTR